MDGQMDRQMKGPYQMYCLRTTQSLERSVELRIKKTHL